MVNELEKENVVYVVMDFVEDGMMFGFGIGLIVKYFVENLVEEIVDGLVVCGVLMSE